MILRPPVCLLCRLVASVADEGRGNTHSVTLAAHARRGLTTTGCIYQVYREYPEWLSLCIYLTSHKGAGRTCVVLTATRVSDNH